LLIIAVLFQIIHHFACLLATHNPPNQIENGGETSKRDNSITTDNTAAAAAAAVAVHTPFNNHFSAKLNLGYTAH